jgi:hypothetical protein
MQGNEETASEPNNAKLTTRNHAEDDIYKSLSSLGEPTE